MQPQAAIVELDPAVRDVVEQIVAEFKPLRIILFGSRAQESAQPDSQID
jgi:predicted nucleotidyltransferase